MRYRISRRITPYLFICPFFIGYAVFFLYPVIWAFYLSFFQQIGFGGDSDFIGFSNYIRLAGDPVFIKSLVNTTIYAIGSFFIILPIALVLALVLKYKGLFWSNGFRLLYFTPFITSGVVVAIIFRLVFEYEYGIINNWLLQPFRYCVLALVKARISYYPPLSWAYGDFPELMHCTFWLVYNAFLPKLSNQLN